MVKFTLIGFFFSSLIPVLQAQDPAATGVATPTTGATTKLLPLNARRLAPENAYTRVYCVVPMIGLGTPADPRRPMFAPAPPNAPVAAVIDRTGIIAYQFQESDDGNFALAEFVAVGRTGLGPILTSTAQNILFFERGKYTRQQIETAFQKYKKNFNFNSFMPVRVQ